MFPPGDYFDICLLTILLETAIFYVKELGLFCVKYGFETMWKKKNNSFYTMNLFTSLGKALSMLVTHITIIHQYTCEMFDNNQI